MSGTLELLKLRNACYLCKGTILLELFYFENLFSSFSGKIIFEM